MSSVHSSGVCPHCGGEAETCLESRDTSSNRLGVVAQRDEYILACLDCGYCVTSMSELHDDGKWYEYETVLTPHKDRSLVDLHDVSPQFSGDSGLKMCLVFRYKDGTMIPVDTETFECLYRRGENGTLIPV